jgi:hypothetical protein
VREHESSELHQLALTKTERVLGPDRARKLLEVLLREHGIELRTPQDLAGHLHVSQSFPFRPQVSVLRRRPSRRPPSGSGPVASARVRKAPAA